MLTEYIDFIVSRFAGGLFRILSLWQIVDGVSFLGFLVAVTALCIVLGAFLYRV